MSPAGSSLKFAR